MWCKSWWLPDCVVDAIANTNDYSLIEATIANGIQPYHHLRRLIHASPAATSSYDYKIVLF